MGASATASLFLWIYFLLLVPSPKTGEGRFGVVVIGWYLVLLVFLWNAIRARAGAVLQTGVNLAMTAITVHLTVILGSLEVLADLANSEDVKMHQQAAATMAEFTAGPAYGVVLACIWSASCGVSRRNLKTSRVNTSALSLGIVASGAVLLAALLRVLLELYLRAISGGEVRLAHPTVLDVLLYAVMLAVPLAIASKRPQIAGP